MIDWITAYCPLELFSEDDRRYLSTVGDRVMRYCPVSGDVRYETCAWDSVKSDSHSIVFRAGSALAVQGSPARVVGDGDNVFGSGPSKAHDLAGCLERMLAFLWTKLEVQERPPVSAWEITRIDVTKNFVLDGLHEVRQMLAFLRNAEGGRYRVSQQAGDTVYWNHTSRYARGKAYAKGPQLVAMQKRKEYGGRLYDLDEIELCNRLLRLERTIFRRHWEKNKNIDKWQDLTPEILIELWEEFFGKFIGQEIMNDEELKKRIESVAPTPGQAKAAYSCWWLVKSMGWELAKENQTKSTWYRNLGILRDAGLKVTDLGNGKVIPFKVQKLSVAYEVASWAELRNIKKAA